MSDNGTVKIEVDPTTAKIIEVWYSVVKKPMCFDNIGEFILTACRRYMNPYFGHLPPEKSREIEEAMKKGRGND